MVICGLTIEYCGGNTALDGVDKGYEVMMVKEAVRGITTDATNQMLEKFKQKNIQYLTIDELKKLFFVV